MAFYNFLTLSLLYAFLAENHEIMQFGEYF